MNAYPTEPMTRAAIAPARGRDLLAMLRRSLVTLRQGRHARYLAGATDHADLERLERAWDEREHPRGGGFWQ